MKEPGKRDRGVRALQMVLSGDKKSYLTVAGASEPGHALLRLTTAQSAVNQWTTLSSSA